MSLMRERMMLQLRLATPGRRWMTRSRKSASSPWPAATAWTWSLLRPGHLVDLGHGIAGAQGIHHRAELGGLYLKLKVAGHSTADLLGIDNGGVLLDHAPLLQGADAGLHRHTGQPNRLAQI